MTNYTPLVIKSKNTSQGSNEDDNEDNFDLELEDEADTSAEDLADAFGDLDDDNNEDDNDPSNNSNEDDDDGDNEDGTAGGDEDEDAEDDDYVPTNRENDRIRALNERARIAEARAKEERTKRLKQQKDSIDRQKVTAASTKKMLEATAVSIKAQLVAAHTNADGEAIADLTDKLADVKLDIAAIDNFEYPEVEEDEETTTETSKGNGEDNRPKLPKRAMDWLEKNPWFTDPKNGLHRQRQAEVVAYDSVLKTQGITYDNAEYYKKMDARLKVLGLAPKQKSNVDLGNNNSSERRKTNTSGNGNGKKVISKTVQGASRQASSTQKNQRRSKVVLTPAQQAIADTMGISYRDYAEEMLRIENTKKTSTNMLPLHVKR